MGETSTGAARFKGNPQGTHQQVFSTAKSLAFVTLQAHAQARSGGNHAVQVWLRGVLKVSTDPKHIRTRSTYAHVEFKQNTVPSLPACLLLFA